MKEIKARFKGQDGSLGYRHGEWYTLILTSGTNSIKRKDGTGYCVYDSIYAFFENWDV